MSKHNNGYIPKSDIQALATLELAREWEAAAEKFVFVDDSVLSPNNVRWTEQRVAWVEEKFESLIALDNAEKVAVELDKPEASRDDIIAKAEKLGITKYDAMKMLKEIPKAGRGKYSMVAFMPVPEVVAEPEPELVEAPLAAAVAAPVSNVVPITEGIQTVLNGEGAYVPEKDPTYVKWGSYSDVVTIVKSKRFCPIFITGLSGNGKTMMVEQACANLDREYIRVQITPETDEDDLIGGFRLINGQTVFFKGPVIRAMEAGAILMIDEIDRGSNKLMCLQGLLEGKPVLLKKTGETVKPKEGFTVIATANTKGRGSDDGKFSAAGILDEAFLERFPITIEQPFPTAATELKIIKGFFNYNFPEKTLEDDVATKLVEWADHIRKTYDDEGVDEVISTRRLNFIVENYGIFGDMKKAIAMCIARFDSDTKDSFLDLYTKVTAEVSSTDAGNTETENQSYDPAF